MGYDHKIIWILTSSYPIHPWRHDTINLDHNFPTIYHVLQNVHLYHPSIHSKQSSTYYSKSSVQDRQFYSRGNAHKYSTLQGQQQRITQYYLLIYLSLWAPNFDIIYPISLGTTYFYNYICSHDLSPVREGIKNKINPAKTKEEQRQTCQKSTSTQRTKESPRFNRNSTT